jgi:small-conductance mechanosensitive channel
MPPAGARNASIIAAARYGGHRARSGQAGGGVSGSPLRASRISSPNLNAMPSPELIHSALIAAALALVLAAATVALRRNRFRGTAIMAGVTFTGVAALALLGGWGGSLGEGPIAVALREAALLVVAIGIIRIALTFLFDALLARLALPRILGELVFALALVGYGLARMDAVGVNLAGIITTSAVITGVIAFSLKETLGNLWGGIGLQLDNTCRMGDWIRIDDVTGQVVGIRWRYFSVATNSGETIVIPNGHLITNRVTVLARRGDERIVWRREVDVTVSYATPPSRVLAALDGALARAEIPNVAPAPSFVRAAFARGAIAWPEPDSRFAVTCREFGDDGIRYVVSYWIADPTLTSWTDSQVRLHVAATLARHGMEIPYPHRVLIEAKAADADEVRARELAKRDETLARIPLFAPLTDAERSALAAELGDCPYVADDVITRQGEAADSLYILARGRVAIYDDSASGTGRRDRLAVLDAPAVFGEMGLLTGQARAATALAQGEVLCYRLDKDRFDSILKARPELVESMSQIVVARQAANDATLQALSAEARARQASGRAADLVRRIRNFFAIS